MNIIIKKVLTYLEYLDYQGFRYPQPVQSVQDRLAVLALLVVRKVQVDQPDHLPLVVLGFPQDRCLQLLRAGLAGQPDQVNQYLLCCQVDPKDLADLETDQSRPINY